MSDDTWEGESGNLTDYEGEITGASFEDGEYGVQLHLTINTDVPERPEHSEYYKVGTGWQTLDGGDSIFNPEKDKFHKRSAYYQFFSRAAALAGEAIKSRGNTTKADIWVGTRWFFSEVTTAARGDIPEYSKNYPSKFLGFVDQNGQTAVKKSDTDPLSVLTPETADLMRTSSKLLDHGAWVDKMLEEDEIRKEGKLVSLMASSSADSLYEKLRSSDE